MKKLISLMNKNKKIVAGLMSGTSVDGIDCAIVEIERHGVDTRVNLIKYHNHEIPKELREDILLACSPEYSNVELICRLNFQLGEELAKAVLEACKLTDLDISNIDLIGSHGQTIYHVPQNSTLQIGEPSIIAERTGVVTIADFRVRDVAAGGHGAPLVPYTEYLLYRNKKKTIALQNIGGIGNVTVIPKDSTIDEVYAFDTGPGNMIIDAIVYEITKGRLKYDYNGEIASTGSIVQELIDELMGHPYIMKKLPKTTGREEFGLEFSKKIYKRYKEKGLRDEDILASITYFTAFSIVDSYKRWIIPHHQIDEVIIGGGGSYNSLLVNIIKEELKLPVKTNEDIGLSSDAKEAIAFAILANEAIHGNSGNLPKVTGASKSVVLGKIIY